MTISAIELEFLVCNSKMNDRLRLKIGEALKTAIYDPEKTYSEKYKVLSKNETYNFPDDEMLLLCAFYLQDTITNLVLEFKLI